MRKYLLQILFTACLSLLLTPNAFPIENEKQTDLEQTHKKLELLNSSKKMDSVYIKAKELLSKSGSDSHFLAESAKYLSRYFMSQSNIDSANYYYHIAAKSYANAHDNVSEGEMYIRLAYNLKNIGDTDNAIRYYLLGLSILDEYSASPLWYGLASDHLGFIYFKQGNYFLALKHYQKGLESCKSIDDKLNIGLLYNKMGLVYRKTQDKKKEEEAYNSALENLEQLKPSITLAEVYNNLSEIYIDKGEYKKGFSILEKAKLVYKEIDYPLGLCSYYLVHAYHHSVLEPVNYYKVIEYGELGVPIAETYKDWRLFADFSSYLGEAYIHTKQFDKAEKTLKKAISVAKTNGFLPEVQKNAEKLALLYEKTKQAQKSLEYYSLYIHLNDSLQGIEKIKEFTELDLSFKFKQEQIRDSIGQIQKMQKVQLEHESELKAQKLLKMIYLIISILVIVIALTILINARKNKKLATLLKEKNYIVNKSLEEKEILLKEIHHRVKNSLQLVSSLLELQSKDVKDEKALKSINDSHERVKAMALIHQNLYQNKNLSTIDISDYVQLLVNSISIAYSAKNKINFQINIDELYFDIDTAIPLGLILNELITNAVKYVFSEQKSCKIDIIIRAENDTTFLLIVKDNGIGLNDKMEIEKNTSLGLRLVKRLAKQLHGKMEFNGDHGAKFKIYFKNTEQRKKIE